MKRLLPLLLALAFVSTEGNAASVEIAGKVKQDTCKIVSGDVAVALGKVDAGSLATDNAEAAHTPFAIELDCAADTSSVAIQFDSQIHGDPVTGNLRLEGANAASGVQLAIYDEAGRHQFVNGPVAAESFRPIQSGPMTLGYQAAYRATGSVIPGTANTQAIFTVAYQ